MNNMMYQQEAVEIYYGPRDISFKKLIISFLKKGKLKQEYIDLLTTEDCMEVWGRAFTHSSVDPDNNYEYLEFLGDSIANAAIVWYFDQKFPQLRCQAGVKVLARLKIQYVSKQTFYEIAEKLGFWRFISGSVTSRQRSMKSMLEDSLEALIGATVELINKKIHPRAGFGIIQDIIEDLYNDLDITLDYYKLFDSITILKEIFDNHKELGKMSYQTNTVKDETMDFPVSFAKVYAGNVLLAEGQGAKMAIAKQNASRVAIEKLRNRGIYPKISEIYKSFCKI